MAGSENETLKYLNSLEEEFGGKITNKLLSIFYADTNGIVRDYGVFMYQIGDILHYEDFDRKPTIFGIPLNKDTEYVKFRSEINIRDITGFVRVPKDKAIKFCTGKTDKIKPAGAFTRLFGQTVIMVNSNSHGPIFLELPEKTLQAVIDSIKEK